MDFIKPAAALSRFFESGKDVVLGRNEVVVAIDETPKGVYLVYSGRIKVVSVTGTGEERIDLILKEGDLFPIGWALGDMPICASYAAMGDTRLRLQSLERFNQFINTHPGAIAGVIPKLLAAYARVHNLNLDTARERVIHRLLVLSERFASKADDHKNGFVVIDLRQTQQEFASSVRLSRETAGKILNELELANAIILGRKVVRVFPEKLIAMLHDGEPQAQRITEK
ncbi:MAG: transcriptional regulator, Crp/Fnr family [Patescibacteria group bacterium]|nr:transcriptional regulator, Crp/Fnr family [Patescibacteria group bacterium]